MKIVSSSMDLSQLTCQHLKGIGKRTAFYLQRLGINEIQDVLFHLPYRYQDRTRIHPIATLTTGEHAVIEGIIATVTAPIGGRTRQLCRLEDSTGHIHLRFFYINPIQQKTIKPGVKLRCFGEIRFGKLGLEMIHPEYQVITAETAIQHDGYLTPIYPTTEGLSQQKWRKLTTEALQLLTDGGILPDIFPANLLQELNFPTLKEALYFVHRPPPETSVDLLHEGQHRFQKRLVFEELLAHRLSLLHLKNKFQLQRALPLLKRHSLTAQFITALPFELTSAQKKVVEEISEDLIQPHPMLRLVQGDVGSGKTVVAALAILQAIENGVQAALLAPTELLVEQHTKTFTAWLEPLGLKISMLTGTMKNSQRQKILTELLNGDIHLVIGTHAIFQKEVSFRQLALIIVDEQHRFGVQQRLSLREKGVHNDSYPHQLIMTATPIPRTLAMSSYADLDCSIIDELPPGRTPVNTRVISNTRRQEILARIREACLAHRQAYWVCTLIEESEVLQCQTAEETYQLLNEALPELKVALLHGRMKTAEKEQVMHAFKKGDTHLLVATTVIEVGVDVPNASVMVIENAERLGLAQLHQLRGRVGRGSTESHCLLLYQDPLSRLAKERLAIMRATTDGFKIAERDLELRGPGEVLGTKQTGDIALRIADLVRDSDLLPTIQQAAELLQKHYPHLIHPIIKRWIGHNDRFSRV